MLARDDATEEPPAKKLRTPLPLSKSSRGLLSRLEAVLQALLVPLLVLPD